LVFDIKYQGVMIPTIDRDIYSNNLNN
jgi:hypothetical protein